MTVRAGNFCRPLLGAVTAADEITQFAPELVASGLARATTHFWACARSAVQEMKMEPSRRHFCTIYAIQVPNFPI